MMTALQFVDLAKKIAALQNLTLNAITLAPSRGWSRDAVVVRFDRGMMSIEVTRKHGSDQVTVTGPSFETTDIALLASKMVTAAAIAEALKEVDLTTITRDHEVLA